MFRVVAVSMFFMAATFSHAVPAALGQSGDGFGGAILDIVPTTPLNTVTGGAAGPFYVEAQVFLGRTVSTSDCTINSTAQQTFLQGGRQVGTLRIWGQRTGATTGSQTGTGTLETPFGSIRTNNITGGALAVFNMSLELNGFNGTVQFQGTLGRVLSNFLSTNNASVDVIAVTGGTGTFNGATGQAYITPLFNTTASALCSTGAVRARALMSYPGLNSSRAYLQH